MMETTNVEWTNELVLEFLSLYKSHPIIWDPSHKKYKDRKMTYNAWMEIRDELDISNYSINALKAKKESLMSIYRTVKKKIRDSKDSDGIPTFCPKWFAFELMDSFLGNSQKKQSDIICKPEGSSIEENLESETEEIVLSYDSDSGVKDEYPMKIELLKPIEFENEKNVHVEPIRPKNAVKRKATSTTIEHNWERRNRISDFEKNQEAIALPSPMDEYSLYGELLATKLRSLSKRTGKILTNQIDNLVFEAEMKELDQIVNYR